MKMLSWRDVASTTDFSVVALRDESFSPPRLCQWGGDGRPPTSITLRYEAERIQITTYAQPIWGEMSPWEGLDDVVQSSFGFLREAEQVSLTAKDQLERGHGAQGVLPHQPTLDDQTARKKATVEAGLNYAEVEIGGVVVQAIIFGYESLWSAGFEFESDNRPLVTIVTGGVIPFQSLHFRLVSDLLALLRIR